MKSIIITAAVASSIASALPATGLASTDTENGWKSILSGTAGAECSNLAVIFARGTFDSGNIGTFVGAPFRDDLMAKYPSVAFQGVDAGDYPADLAGYIEEGGSETCARSLASDVETYAKACPNSKIVISGWSQGALCARKSFMYVNDRRQQIVGFVTFGDPSGTWRSTVSFPQIPSRVEHIGLCKGSPVDYLCGQSMADFPKTPSGVVRYFKEMSAALDEADFNSSQKRSVATIMAQLPLQATWQLGRFAKDLIAGNLQRWMLSPQHFFYGVDGSVEEASDRILALL